MSEWQPISTAPMLGNKIVIVTDDGCSSGLGLVTDDGILDGEDGEPYSECFLKGAIWAPLPDDYALGFMERHDDY